MYKVAIKFIGCSVNCAKFNVLLKDATQDQLEHLFHLGHNGIDFIGKKPKNKPVDNFIKETNTYKDEQEIAPE